MATDNKTIDISKVIKVYSGKPGCCCGCLGKYSYASATAEQQSKMMGYKVDVSDRNVKQIVKILNENIDKVEFGDDGSYAHLTLGNRWYNVYFVI